MLLFYRNPMETWETLTMSRKEVPRAGLVKAALAGRIFVDNAVQNAAGTKKVTGFKLHPSFYLFFDKISVAP